VLFFGDKNLSYSCIIPLPMDGKKLRQEIEAVVNDADKSRLKEIRFIRIKNVILIPIETKAHKTMGVNEELYIEVEVSIHGISVIHEFSLVRIKSNWHIIYISK
jgi:hypothetical protein